MSIAESEDEESAESGADESSSSSSSAEETDEDDDDDEREDIELYETEEQRVAFNPSVKSSPTWTQWQRELKAVYNQYITEGLKFKKQTSRFDT
jgi:hypothetical protein